MWWWVWVEGEEGVVSDAAAALGGDVKAAPVVGCFQTDSSAAQVPAVSAVPAPPVRSIAGSEGMRQQHWWWSTLQQRPKLTPPKLSIVGDTNVGGEGQGSGISQGGARCGASYNYHLQVFGVAAAPRVLGEIAELHVFL